MSSALATRSPIRNTVRVATASPRLSVVSVRVGDDDSVHVVGRIDDFDGDLRTAKAHARTAARAFADQHRCQVDTQVIVDGVPVFSTTATAPLGVERWFGEQRPDVARTIHNMLAAGCTEAAIARALREGGA